MQPARRPRSRLAWPAALLLGGLAGGCATGGGQGLADRSGRLVLPLLGPAAAPSPYGQFLVGQFAAEAQDTQVAADALLGALGTAPDQPALLQRAFLAALMDGRAEAEPLARRLPDHLPAQLLLFGTELEARRYDRAEARARALGRHGAAGALQPVLLAWTLAGRQQHEAALALLRPLAEQGRLRALNALHAALIAELAQRPREAERYARLALADQPDPTLRLALLAAGVLHRAGRPGEAQRVLDRLTQSLDDLALAALGPARESVLAQRAIAGPAEGVAEAYVALGAALRGQGLDDLSGLFAQLALRLRPAFAPALLLLADLQAEAGRLDAAQETLARVPPGDPLHGPAQLRRAGLLDRLDRLPEAERLLADAAERFAPSPQSLLRQGDILRRRSRFAEAALVYDRAVARLPQPRPHDWPVFFARGIARERSGDWPGAEADLLRALDLAPDQPYVLNYLAYSWADRGENLPRARAMLERAVAQRPQDGNIADSLGWALFRMGDLAGAIHWLERAVELEPRSATINDHLGDAYWAVGRVNEARFQWRRALTLDPEPLEAARIEAKLANGLPVGGVPQAARR